MKFQDISHFSNTADYLPIVAAAIIVDLIVMMRVVLGQIKSVSLTAWYQQYGGMGVMADVLSIVIGIIIARSVYPIFFSTWSLPLFLMVTVAIQVTHDLTFAALFNAIPRGASDILDTFKDYAAEFGPVILLADAAMMVGTVLLGSLLASQSLNTNIIVFLVALYFIPYVLYSI
jgi:hypothetical protein